MTSDYHFRMSRIDVSRIPDTKTQFCLKRLKGEDADHSITTVIRVDEVSYYKLSDEDNEDCEDHKRDIVFHNAIILGTGFHFGKKGEYPVELKFTNVDDHKLSVILRICKVGVPVKATGCFLLNLNAKPVEMTILNPVVSELDAEKVSFYKWVSERD